MKSKGPDWWVKIGDFGISKRAEDILETTIGTPAFLAPEVLVRFGYLDDDILEVCEEYTVAVDIWSLGEIVFRALTAEPVFLNRSLRKYIMGTLSFPLDVLRAHGVSCEGCDLLKRLMAPMPKDRLTVREALGHKWFQSQGPPSTRPIAEMQRYLFFNRVIISQNHIGETDIALRSSPMMEEAIPSNLANPTSIEGSPAEGQLLQNAISGFSITERPGEKPDLEGVIRNVGSQVSEDYDHAPANMIM